MRGVDGVGGGGAEGDNFTETLTGCTTLGGGDFVMRRRRDEEIE